MMDELVAYTPHTGPSYEPDNAQVYNLLSNSLVGTNVMNSITRHQRRRYGRSAYLDLVTHNMGSENWENTVEQAESAMETRVWNGHNSKYPLKDHIDRHREAFNDLVRASYKSTMYL